MVCFLFLLCFFY